MLTAPATTANADLRNRVFDWLQQASPILRQSSWGEHLLAEGIDVVDAGIADLYVRLLGLARQDQNTFGPVEPHGLRGRAVRFARDPHLPETLRATWRRTMAARRSSAAERADIVCWPVHETHVRQQVPVARALEEIGLKTAFVATDSMTFAQARREGAGAIFASKLWGDALGSAEDEGRRAAAALRREPQDLRLPEFAGWQADQVVDLLKASLVAALPRVHRAVAAMKQIQRDLDPHVLVAGNVLTVDGRTAARYCAQQGIPVTSIMHGAVGGGEPIDGAHVGDSFLVFGEASRRELIRLGVPPGILRVCGAPALDRRPAQTGRLHPLLETELQLSPHASYVLFATSGPGHCTSPGHLDTLIRAVTVASARMPAVSFVAKLHPKDSRLRYAAPASGRPLPVFEHGELPLQMFDWLQGCRALITTTSFVALEAMVMRVPVITLDFAAEYKDVDFIDAGATLHVRDERELAAALTAVIDGGPALDAVQARARAFTADAFSHLDGSAARTCADAIAELVTCAE